MRDAADTRVSHTDVVCGMTPNADTPHRAEHDGALYLFCGERCADRFRADPARYLDASDDTGPVDDDRIYTCPMHPEIRQIGPGPCPDCGMALEPAAISLDAPPNPELADFGRRLRWAVALTVPVFLLAMGEMIPGRPLDRLVPPPWQPWLQFALATPVVAWCGGVFFRRGWTSFTTGQLNMFSLIAVGTGAAWAFSVVGLVAPGVLPPSMLGPSGHAPIYFESAAVIVTLVLVGQVLELRARDRTGSALRELLRLAPDTATRVSADGGEQDVALDAVRSGDRLRVRPGDRVPVDGCVERGESAIDESMLTGEPVPIPKTAGDAVIGGTLNGNGTFIMIAQSVGQETMLARIVNQVADAQRSRAPAQQVADRVAAVFVPIVFGVALLAFGTWWAFGPDPALAHAVVAAVSVLIIACPCALGLATPMSVMVAMGRGAKEGVLFRDAEALERLRDVDALVVDKTGTLTEGRPEVTRSADLGEVPESVWLAAAASLERGSAHPLADAVVRAAEARGLALSEPDQFESEIGRGIRGAVGGRRISVGSRAFVLDEGASADALAPGLASEPEDGGTVIAVAVDDRPAGLLTLRDPLKESAGPSLDALRAAGVEIFMATGDGAAAAADIASRVGIPETHVRSRLLPDEKNDWVAALQSQGRVVAMVGDGVNDSPALARADIGIAMGTGSDVALHTAAVTLLGGDLAGLLRARRLSEATARNLRQNLAFAFGYNAAGVPIAAGALYPLTGWLLSPMIAALAMSASSISVIANALRLRRAGTDSGA